MKFSIGVQNKLNVNVIFFLLESVREASGGHTKY
jgi:hypothetical protein